MPNEWSFRSEILLATQRWPWLALFCLVGSLLGWIVSLTWPTPHRAMKELYVGLNVYRALNDQNVYQYAGIKLVNANDYKNWQMASLNTLVYMDDVISQTLSTLRQQDPYWQNVNNTELAHSLHVYWRNAGKWRLVAENENPHHAAQAVSAWQDAVVDRVHKAVLDSQQAMLLEFQLRALTADETRLRSASQSAERARQDLENFLAEQNSVSTVTEINPSVHWKIWQSVNNIAVNPGGKSLLDSFPSQGSPTQDYVAWSNEVISFLDSEIQALDLQVEDLQRQEKEITDLFSSASKSSLGLSASLDVDIISDAPSQQMVTRPTGMLMLAGSLLGLVACLTLWIGGISLRGNA
jgi:prefoldin subunit 5